MSVGNGPRNEDHDSAALPAQSAQPGWARPGAAADASARAARAAAAPRPMNPAPVRRLRAMALLAVALLAVSALARAQPVQIEDDRGRLVSLPRPPQRIVSLLPSLTESLCALGHCQRIVGVARQRAAPGAGPGRGGAGAQDPRRCAPGAGPGQRPARRAARARVRPAVARDRCRHTGSGPIAAARGQERARVFRGRPRALCGGRGLVHRRDADPAGCAQCGAGRARTIPAPEPGVRAARRPRHHHDRQPRHAGHAVVPRLGRPARRPRATHLRLQPGPVRHAGAPRPAHGRGGPHHGPLPGRQSARSAQGARGAIVQTNTNTNPQTAAARPASGATPPPGATHQPALRCGAWLLLASALLALCGASVGSTGWDSLLHLGDDPVAWQILWSIRLPRTLGAWLAGPLLGLAGAVAQGLFRNPLADPYLLGSASGAALGAALALALLGVSPVAPQWLGRPWLLRSARIGIPGMAFVGAAGAVLLPLLLARGVQHPLRLLLAGVIVGVVLGALRELLQLAAPDILQAMQAFTLGSTAFVGAPACVLMALAWVSCAALAWMLARALDGLTLGEATAASLGLPLLPMRAGLVAALALAPGTAVAQTGLIAFVGLAAPHLLRSIVRVTHARHILLSSLMGAVLLLAADILARWLLGPQELPVGVLTAALGGSYLLWLMHRRSTQSAGP